MIQLLTGDCRTVLATLPDASVHCVVTSPPYYGLRDYGTAQWDGGDAACDHMQRAGQRQDVGRVAVDGFHGSSLMSELKAKPYVGECGKCGARRIDRQMGLEATPDAYLQAMVAVFREVRRVLRPDGTVWCNIGDSYNANQGSGFDTNRDGASRKAAAASPKVYTGLAPKQLLLMPARLALALQADGWWVRSDIIWAKPNPMPESCRDRPVNSYEHVFLLSKSPRYFYDAIAIAEPTAAHETLQLLSDREAGHRVRQSEVGQGWSDEGMPLLRYIEGAQMASNARGTGEIAGCQPAASRQAGTPSQDGRISTFRHDEGRACGVAQDAERDGISQDVSGIGKAKGGQQAPLRERQGQGVDCAVSCDGEGQSEPSARRPQAAGSHADSKHADCGGMGGDQGESRSQVPLLQEVDPTPDDGSRHPVEQRRASHSDEHRPSMQKLQQPQGKQNGASAVRSARNVWTIATEAFSAAHFATFPTALAERCIRAGTSERGCCAQCGKPWVRQTSVSYTDAGNGNNNMKRKAGGDYEAAMSARPYEVRKLKDVETLGWSAGCKCNAEVVPATVLDPFAGSGTTLMVADRLQRNAIGIDLNADYTEMAMQRCRDDAPLLTQIEERNDAYDRGMRDLFQEAAD